MCVCVLAALIELVPPFSQDDPGIRPWSGRRAGRHTSSSRKKPRVRACSVALRIILPLSREIVRCEHGKGQGMTIHPFPRTIMLTILDIERAGSCPIVMYIRSLIRREGWTRQFNANSHPLGGKWDLKWRTGRLFFYRGGSSLTLFDQFVHTLSVIIRNECVDLTCCAPPAVAPQGQASVNENRRPRVPDGPIHHVQLLGIEKWRRKSSEPRSSDEGIVCKYGRKEECSGVV